ncbi:PilZ domain-containing protein [bacterium]|nr:PilZ domain-containing protein [bacterium]
MSNQREERVKVDIPIRFTYKDDSSTKKVTSSGRIDDISLNGMRVELPLSAEIIERDHIDFSLELPNPFMKIKGQGKIQWKRWNAEKNCTTCGLKLEPMTLSQLSDLDAIISEVMEDATTEKI